MTKESDLGTDFPSKLAAKESERLRRQEKIDSSAPTNARNQAGQFATPSELATEIARYAKSLVNKDDFPVHLSDPALGTGAFFSAAQRVFGPADIASASGVEIDSGLASVAQELWTEFGLEVTEGDFTKEHVRGSVRNPSLILTNPPYVRHHHLKRNQKSDLQSQVERRLGFGVSGLAGLYVYYFLLATDWMTRGGLALWLLPSEFLEVNYGTVLRRFLCDKVTLLRVHRFDPEEVQFADALVTSAVIAIRKTKPSGRTVPRFTYGGTLIEPKQEKAIQLDQLRHAPKWTEFLDPHGLPRKQVPSLRLGDLFTVRRGIATGANDFFILRREEAERRAFAEACLRPILPSSRHLDANVVETEEDGYPKVDPQLVLLDPPFTEEQLQEEFPRVWRYLQTALGRGVRERYLVRHRTPWYKQEFRDVAPFLCTYMGRGANGRRAFRFIWNQSQAIATNVYLMLYPRSGLGKALIDDPDLAALVFELLSSIADAALRREGRTYGGGLNKLEPKELSRVPLPSTVKDLPYVDASIQLELQGS